MSKTSPRTRAWGRRMRGGKRHLLRLLVHCQSVRHMRGMADVLCQDLRQNGGATSWGYTYHLR